MKKTKTFFILFFVLILLVSTISVSAENFQYERANEDPSQGTFKKESCVNIKQGCSTCSNITISISYPNSTLSVQNQSMNYTGSGLWIYDFCDTSNIGRYEINGEGDVSGVDESFATYFEITENGLDYDVNNGGQYLIMIAFAVICSFIFIGFGISKINFSGGRYLNLVLKRSAIVIGLLLMAITSTMVYTIQESTLTPVGISMYRFIWIFQWAAYLMIVYTVLKTMFDVYQAWGEEKKQERMGGDL